METANVLKKILPYIVIVVVAAVFRIIPHAPNFAPITGLALFTGYHFKNKLTWTLPVIAMIISDAVIGFHSTIPYVYASFIAISVIGSFLKNTNIKTLFLASLSSSVLFFVVTNFGVWATGTMYVKNIAGLIQSYVMGIPFFRNTIAGDLFYSLSFFYGYSYLANLLGKKAITAKFS